MKRIKKLKQKVQKKPWAEPLGKTLAITGEIIDGLDFIPGAGIIAGALSFGSGLLSPEASDDRNERNSTKK